MELLINPQTSTVQQLKFGNEYFHPTFYWVYEYIYLLGVELTLISKRDPRFAQYILGPHDRDYTSCSPFWQVSYAFVGAGGRFKNT